MDSTPNYIDRLLKHRIGLHILFWGMISLIFYSFFSMYVFSSFQIYLVNLIAILPAQIFLSYLIVYFLIPKLLYRKKYLLFALTFIVSIYLSMVVARTLTIYVVEDINQRGFEKESLWLIATQFKHNISRYLSSVMLAPMIFVPIKLLKDRLQEKKEIEELEKEKINAQLSLLKAQINPHFLFNTLNNLYLLTLEKRDEAPDVVLKLSEMMDYMLYQCNVPKVPLRKEIELLKNYIDLEKLRYDDQLKVLFTTNVSDLNVKIAPLILLTLVENAFKHGSSPAAMQSSIKVEITEENSQLGFKVFNTKPEHPAKVISKGVGLKNMTTQLALLYPQKHKLTIKDDLLSYEVSLKIDL